jgi:hypothetical protein
MEGFLYPRIVFDDQNQTHVYPLEESWLSNSATHLYHLILYRYSVPFARDPPEVTDSYHQMTNP